MAKHITLFYRTDCAGSELVIFEEGNHTVIIADMNYDPQNQCESIAEVKSFCERSGIKLPEPIYSEEKGSNYYEIPGHWLPEFHNDLMESRGTVNLGR